LSYYEICEKISQGWSVRKDEEQKVPYAYKDSEWVGYDDKESLALKVIH
jgi:chitinase